MTMLFLPPEALARLSSQIVTAMLELRDRYGFMVDRRKDRDIDLRTLADQTALGAVAVVAGTDVACADRSSVDLNLHGLMRQ